jgi:aspartate aminotransferase
VTALAAQLRAEGRDVIGLAAGEPDFDTPDYIKQAAIRAIQDGHTRYTAVDGTAGLKRAIINKFERENALHYNPDQILVSVGGKQVFYNLVQALLNPGDEVIIPAPYWVSYPDMVKLADGEPVIIAAGIEQAFKISPAQLEAAISPRTRLVVINSPSNPSGKSYSRAEMTALAEVLLRYPEIVVVTDDIYEHIVWSEGGFFNILNVCPELTPRTLVLNGVSKAYAMTGWRIGYGGGPAELIKGMKKVQSQSTSNPCSIAQYAAQAALEGNQDFLVEMCAVFKQRHDYVCERLNAMPGVECLASDGTFYSFPSFQGVIARMAGINNDIELAQLLLESAEVALVPGSAFGGADHLRLSYATSMDNLEKALDRIATTISQG